ncbi:hypothetical protein [Bosea sp. 2RAB26]|uniref:hypothetical protein n=1 Tax=Bosea sp. 2RAB26 TaxID=3237476 RepID=UPI003F933D5E
MEAWIDQWAIPYRAVTVPRDNGAIRMSFAEEKFARAFHTNFGGLRVPADNLATELAADPAVNGIHEFVGTQGG